MLSVGFYVINLDRSPDRLLHMQQQLNAQNIPFTRVSAIDGKKINHNDFLSKNYEKYYKILLAGEIGCYLSHIKTLETFMKSKYDYAVILEDDCIISEPNFKDLINEIISKYNHEWDILKLFGQRKRYFFIKDINTKYNLVEYGLSVPTTTTAAIWTKQAASTFLEKQTNPLKVYRPIDCELQFPWEYDINIYNIQPSPITLAPLTSIRNESSNKTWQIKLQKIKYEIKRIFPKLKHILVKHNISHIFHFIFK